MEYVTEKLLDEPADKATQEEYAKRGFVHVPATGTHGGVRADGGIRRDATLSLAALRLLSSGKDKDKTLVLRRYVLGLSLVALTATSSTYLRQGCNLVPDVEKPREFMLVHSDGVREAIRLDHAEAMKFASAAAKAFVVGPDKLVEFDKELAKKDIAGEGDNKAALKAAAKKAAAEAKKAAADSKKVAEAE